MPQKDDTKVEFEVQVWRKNHPTDILPEWTPLLSGIDEEAKATQYRNFLIDDRGYLTENVLVVKYTWQCTHAEIWSYNG